MGEVDGTSALLGELKARVDVVMAFMQDESKVAREHRQALHVTVTAQGQSMRDLTFEIKEMARRMEKIEPVVDQSRTDRDQALGAARFLKVVWIIAVAGGAGLLINVFNFVSHR